MKPDYQTSRQTRSHQGEESFTPCRSTRPAIEQRYHTDARDFRTATNRVVPAPRPSLRQLSREFLAAETKRDYVMEAVCFTILVSVSAWPMVEAVRALSLLR